MHVIIFNMIVVLSPLFLEISTHAIAQCSKSTVELVFCVFSRQIIYPLSIAAVSLYILFQNILVMPVRIALICDILSTDVKLRTAELHVVGSGLYCLIACSFSEFSHPPCARTCYLFGT
jgi:hypothetical protein